MHIFLKQVCIFRQINLPPKDYEQEIPRSFKELFMQPKANIEVARKSVQIKFINVF